MEIKKNYSASNIVNELLSVILAFSIVAFCASIVFLSCFKTTGFVERKFQAYNTEVVEAVNDRLELIANESGFSAEAYTSCFNEETANIVLNKIIKNISYSYTTIFSDDADIYAFFKTGITNYCYENNIDISKQEISANASLAVDAVNEVLGGPSTAKIQVVRFVNSSKMMAVIIASAFMIVGSMTVIYALNKGRHRRLNYYGMGVTSAGAVLTFGSLFAVVNNYAGDYKFCENIIYDKAIGDITLFSIDICMLVGIPFILIGFVLLIGNYHYYKAKKRKQDELIENKQKMRLDSAELFSEGNIPTGEVIGNELLGAIDKNK